MKEKNFLLHEINIPTKNTGGNRRMANNYCGGTNCPLIYLKHHGIAILETKCANFVESCNPKLLTSHFLRYLY